MQKDQRREGSGGSRGEPMGGAAAARKPPPSLAFAARVAGPYVLGLLHRLLKFLRSHQRTGLEFGKLPVALIKSLSPSCGYIIRNFADCHSVNCRRPEKEQSSRYFRRHRPTTTFWSKALGPPDRTIVWREAMAEDQAGDRAGAYPGFNQGYARRPAIGPTISGSPARSQIRSNGFCFA